MGEGQGNNAPKQSCSPSRKKLPLKPVKRIHFITSYLSRILISLLPEYFAHATTLTFIREIHSLFLNNVKLVQFESHFPKRIFLENVLQIEQLSPESVVYNTTARALVSFKVHPSQNWRPHQECDFINHRGETKQGYEYDWPIRYIVL